MGSLFDGRSVYPKYLLSLNLHECGVCERDIKGSFVLRFVFRISSFHSILSISILSIPSLVIHHIKHCTMGSIGNSWKELDVAVIGGGIGKKT
jgi:hypothetical protein